MSTAKRIKETKRRKTEPFAWLPGGLLMSTAVCRLGHAALRLFLLMNANYTRVSTNSLRTVVPYSQAKKLLGCGKSTITGAFRELEERQLIVQSKAGTRPNTAGGALGRAAEWRIPYREGGVQTALPLPHGLRRPSGALRLHVGLMRRDVNLLSGPECKVLVLAIANHDRSNDGSLVKAEPFALSTRHVAALLDLSVGAVNEALKRLVAYERLILVERGIGSRPSTYLMAPDYTKHERWLTGKPRRGKDLPGQLPGPSGEH